MKNKGQLPRIRFMQISFVYRMQGEIKSLIPYSIIKYNKDRQIEDSNIDNTYL